MSENTSQALHYSHGRYLQPGESTQVGAVLDVDVGGATAAAAVGVLGSFRHGGHCRWSSLGRQSALRYRSGTVRLVRAAAGVAGARPLLRAARAPARPPSSALARAPGRPAGWSSRIVLPPPRTPLSAFYRHARLNAGVAVHFSLFCPKIWQIPLSRAPGRRRAGTALEPEARRRHYQRALLGRCYSEVVVSGRCMLGFHWTSQWTSSIL